MTTTTTDNNNNNTDRGGESDGELELFEGLRLEYDSETDEEEQSEEVREEMRRRKEIKEREKFLVTCKNFRPQEGKPGWFNLPEGVDVVKRLREDKNCAAELKHSMEYHYMRREFRKVCDLGHIILAHKYLHKGYSTKEVKEIVIRSHLRLGEFEEAKTISDTWKNIDGPRQVFLKAQVCSLVGDLEGTLSLFKYYLRNQLIDYQAWKEIGLAIERYFNPTLRTWSPTLPTHQEDSSSSIPESDPTLVTRCYELSHQIMVATQRNIGLSPSSQAWFHHQLALIQSFLTRSRQASPPPSPLPLSPALLDWLLQSITTLEELGTTGSWDKVAEADSLSGEGEVEGERSVLDL